MIKDLIGYAYSTIETLENSYELGKQVIEKEVPGDIVEMGIAHGANLTAMLRGAIGRKGWGCDSFEGIQLAGKNDTEQAGIGKITHNVNVPADELLKSSGITVHPEEEVKKNLSRWGVDNRVKLVKGWVQKSLPGVEKEIKSIAILRLDMDVYDPTIYALERLYDKVSNGGIVIIDDWNLAGCVKATQDFFKVKGINPTLHKVKNSNPVFWIKE